MPLAGNKKDRSQKAKGSTYVELFWFKQQIIHKKHPLLLQQKRVPGTKGDIPNDIYSI